MDNTLNKIHCTKNTRDACSTSRQEYRQNTILKTWKNDHNNAYCTFEVRDILLQNKDNVIFVAYQPSSQFFFRNKTHKCIAIFSSRDKSNQIFTILYLFLSIVH